MKKFFFTMFIMIIAISADLMSQNRAVIKNLTISKGTSKSVVVLSWKSVPEKCKYLIYRSLTEDGEYVKIAELTTTVYANRDVRPGIKYFYRLYAVYDGTASQPYSDFGFTSPPVPPGLMPEKILKSRNKKMPKPSSHEEKDTWDIHLKSIKKYYENVITISIIMLVGKIYVRNGKLIVYRDFNEYTIDYWKKTIYVYKKGMNPIKFYSKRLFRFLQYCKKNGIEEQDILPRLISNAIFFCIRRGSIETQQDDGTINILPQFEALGMSTEYFRDYKKWRTNTIVFGSDTKDLDELINKNRPH